MKKKKKKASVPNFKPVRVVNPTAAWHTTRLYACQSMLLKMRKPSIFLSCANETAEFVVSMQSEFLIIEHVDVDKVTGDTVYRISQKFDLTDWTEYGEVLLGELNIRLINNTHENADKQDYACNICVILNGNDEVLTVVNPSSDHVKVQAHQLLEVVCYESTWNNGTETKSSVGLRDEWDHRVNDLASNLKNLLIKQVKYEIAGDRRGVLVKDEGPFAVKNRFHFRVNPRLDAMGRGIVEGEIKERGTPIREHHWWFACDADTLKKVDDLANGVYSVCTLDFDGQCRETDDDKTTTNWQTRNLNVLLAVHGKNKHKMHPYYLNPDSVEHKIELTKRTEDRYKQILTNPLATEQVDFHPGYETILLEIVQPSCLWSDVDESVQWTFEIDENRLAPKHVRIIPEVSYYRWGRLFQRVRIDHDYVPKNDAETKFLGAVYIICEPKREAHDGKKRISFWLTPTERRGATFSSGPKKTSTSVTNSNKSVYSGPCNQNGSKKKEKEYRKPQIAVLEIEEIDCKNLEDAGPNSTLKTKKVSDVWVGGNSYRHTSHCDNGDFCHVAKKKETNSMSVGDRTYRASSANETKNASSGESSEKKESSGGSITTGGTRSTVIRDGADACSALVVYNPTHLRRVTLEYGQPLTVRMSMPKKLHAGKCNDEHWSLSWDGGTSRSLNVLQYKTVTIAESFYQEVQAVIDNVPPTPGVHPVGCLRFHCSAGTRVVFVEVRVYQDDKVVQKPVAIPTMRIVPPTRCFDGINSPKVYISEWLHNDAFVVAPLETFYVRSPAHLSGWELGGWHLEIEQYPLLSEILNHELVKCVAKDIDFSNPWFPTSHPLQLATTYLFRSLAIQQPHAIRILEAAADTIDDEYLVIARLTFRNSHHQLNSRLKTAVGIMETNYTLEKSLGICVDLRPFRQQTELLFVNPNHQEEITVHGNEMLTIKLSPRFIEMERGCSVRAPWFAGPWPEFLDYRGLAEEGGDCVFRFDVRGDYPENKNQYIKFICGNTEKILIAKYEKSQ